MSARDYHYPTRWLQDVAEAIRVMESDGAPEGPPLRLAFRGLRESVFWPYVERGPGCWIWTGFVQRDGYGRYASRYAHRVVWELTRGPIPDGLFVCHHCDNRKCVRPDHLFLGTPAENDADMRAKRREAHLLGEAHPQARLRDNDVREIKRQLAQGVPRRSIVRSFGVCKSTIDQIAAGHIWKHITPGAV